MYILGPRRAQSKSHGRDRRRERTGAWRDDQWFYRQSSLQSRILSASNVASFRWTCGESIGSAVRQWFVATLAALAVLLVVVVAAAVAAAIAVFYLRDSRSRGHCCCRLRGRPWRRRRERRGELHEL